MTNEELAIRIKAGESELLPELWEQVRKLLAYMFISLLNRNPNSRARAESAGVTIEDLEQEGYFALLDAVEAYNDKDGYKFTSYLKYPVMNRFFAAIGFRTRRQRRDLLSSAVSLDEPKGDNGDTFLLDSLADQDALKPFEQVEARIYRAQLHEDLEKSLQSLPEDQESVIRARYYNSATLSEISIARGCSRVWVNQLERQALRKLSMDQRLQVYREEIAAQRAYNRSLDRLKYSWNPSAEKAAKKTDKAELAAMNQIIDRARQRIVTDWASLRARK